MPRRIDLPRDNWAILSERGELSVKERRKVERCMADLAGLREKLTGKDTPEITDFESGELDKVYALQNQTIVSLVRDWSLGELPTIESVEDLPADLYDALSLEAAQTEEAPDFRPQVTGDSANPTVSSSG